MSADRVDVCRCLLCLPGHCTLRDVSSGAVLTDGPEAKLCKICNSDMETASPKITQRFGRGRLLFGILPPDSPW